jgi:hypothetical protein
MLQYIEITKCKAIDVLSGMLEDFAFDCKQNVGP